MFQIVSLLSFFFSRANSGLLRPLYLVFVWINSTLYIKDLWHPCFIQTPNIPRRLFWHILLLAPGCHLTLITAHVQKVRATCITVTTMPRKCNGELGWSERLLKHRWHWALLQLPSWCSGFDSPKDTTSSLHVPTVYMLLVVMHKAMGYKYTLLFLARSHETWPCLYICI